MHLRIEGWWLPDYTNIHVRVMQAGTWWWRGPAWATLSFPLAEPPKSATEGLRWMVQQLDVNLRGRASWPPPYVDRAPDYEIAERMAASGQFG
jgi:hypothetical protein